MADIPEENFLNSLAKIAAFYENNGTVILSKNDTDLLSTIILIHFDYQQNNDEVQFIKRLRQAFTIWRNSEKNI